jgi:hypothetical protein
MLAVEMGRIEALEVSLRWSPGMPGKAVVL